MAVRFIVSLFFAILVALFAIQNASAVAINIFFATYTVSQALVILISAILGGIIVLLLGLVKQIKLNLKIKSTSKMITKLEEENKVLKQQIEALSITPDENKVDHVEMADEAKTIEEI
ncbi:LapA family protein [Clostridiaceae bacterium 35-E11]